MSHIIGFGRRARETYPEGPRSSGVGPQGPQGAAGAQGPAGPQGAAGAQGPQGDPAIGGFGLYSARPAPGNLGARYQASDGGPEWVDDGAVWRPMILGRVGVQVPLVGTWTAFGSAGTNTFTDEAGRIVGKTSGTASVLSGLVVAKPTPCDARVHVSTLAGASGGSTGGSGIVIRNSVTKKAILWLWTKPPLLVGEGWTDDVTPSGGLDTDQAGDFPWLRVTDDGATLRFYSGDGTDVGWKENWNIGVGFWGGDPPDQIGLGFDELNTPVVEFNSWELL